MPMGWSERQACLQEIEAGRLTFAALFDRLSGDERRRLDAAKPDPATASDTLPDRIEPPADFGVADPLTATQAEVIGKLLLERIRVEGRSGASVSPRSHQASPPLTTPHQVSPGLTRDGRHAAYA
jgi:hypothetical protein